MAIKLSELLTITQLNSSTDLDQIITSIDISTCCKSGSSTYFDNETPKTEIIFTKAIAAFVPFGFSENSSAKLIRVSNPKKAFENTKARFQLFESEKSQIINHLQDWPLTLRFNNSQQSYDANKTTGANELQGLILELEKNKWKLGQGIPSGLKRLDQITTGFHFGELSIITGRHSIVNSSLGLNIVNHMLIEEEKTVGLMNLGLSRATITRNLLAINTNTPIELFFSGGIGDNLKKNIVHSAGHLSDTKLYFIGDKRTNTTKLTLNIIMAKHKYNVQVVVIDYLQLIKGRFNTLDTNKIATLANQLRYIAQELNIAIILLAQTKNYNNEMHSFDINKITDTGIPYEEIDLGLYLEDDISPSGNDYRQINIHILKQNYGNQGIAPAMFCKKTLKFDNFTDPKS